MKVFKEIDWYDERFPAFSARKKLLHETPVGVMEVAKKMQLFVNEQIEEMRVNDMKNVRAETGWTTK